MTAVPLGRGAYKRLYGGTPEVKLLNRWLEANPANLREGVSILARPGTTNLLGLDPGDFEDLGSMRGNYTLSGLFNDSLFVVCGDTLYKIAEDTLVVTPISGIVNGTGHPEVTWQKGIGYERLWIADGLLLQYYGGTTHANATLTKGGAIVNGTDKFHVGSTYYVWGTSFSMSDAGTVSNPFVVAPLTDPMGQLVKAIMAVGTPGVDYSNTITSANTQVSAEADTIPDTVVTLTALLAGTGGNSIALVVDGGTALTANHATLINGGIDALVGVEVPDGQVPISVTQVDSYVLIAIGDSQKFYWVNPGETSIDPLNFASKESSPDNISQLRTVGDQVLIIGERSTENWYATGQLAIPFAPIEGRVYARGAIPGTASVVNDAAILVGDDGRVYSIGLQSGDGTDAGWGVKRISNNGIEERIRRQIRREQGLTP